jgi:hypothetical protein
MPSQWWLDLPALRKGKLDSRCLLYSNSPGQLADISKDGSCSATLRNDNGFRVFEVGNLLRPNSRG